MALRAVPEHPKFAGLMARLERSRFEVLGALEMLWHFTGKFTPAGNIGKYTDQQIESWIGWNGEPGALISALVVERWLDKDKQHRLLVHDWAIHSDKAAKAAAKRHGGFIEPTSSPKGAECVPHVEPDSHGMATASTRAVASWPLPVPVPVPVPEPEPEPEPHRDAQPDPTFGKPHPQKAGSSDDASMVASGVLDECRISGRDLRMVLEDVARAELREGADPQSLIQRMASACRDYGAAKPRLECHKGTAKFFGDGDWREPEGWPWKKGEAPAKMPPKTIEELCDLNGFDDPRNQWQPVTQEATSAN